ncbi:zinc finger (C3HC4-type RING finger) family protein [Tanacetum coccineum]
MLTLVSLQIVNEYNELLITQFENQKLYFESLLLEYEEHHERDISAIVRESLKQNTKLKKMLAKLDKGLKEKTFLDDINENLSRNKEIWIGIILKTQERELMQSQYGNQFNVMHNTHSRPQTQSLTFQSSTVMYGGSDGAYFTSSTTRIAGSDGGHTPSRHLKSDGQVDSMQTLHNIYKEEASRLEDQNSGTGVLGKKRGLTSTESGSGSTESQIDESTLCLEAAGGAKQDLYSLG